MCQIPGKIPLLLVAILSFTQAFSQAGIGTTTPDSHSILDIQSTTKAFPMSEYNP